MPVFAARRRRPAMLHVPLFWMLLVTRIAPASALAMQPIDSTTGLEGHWPLNDRATPAADTSGNGHHGTLSGTPAFTTHIRSVTVPAHASKEFIV